MKEIGMFQKVPLAVLSGLVLTVGVGSSVYRMQVNEQKQDCIEQRSGGARASACFDGARQTQQDLLDARSPADMAQQQAATMITDAKGKLDTELAKALNETVPGLQQLASESADAIVTQALGTLLSTLTTARGAAEQQLDAAVKAVLASPATVDAKVAEARGDITTQFESIATQVDGAFVASMGALTESQKRLDDVKAALGQARTQMARTFADVLSAVNGAFAQLPSTSKTVADAATTVDKAPSNAEAQVTDAQTQANGTVATVSTPAGDAVSDTQNEVTSQADEQVTAVQGTTGIDVTSDPSGVGVSVSPSGSGATAGVGTGSLGTSGSAGITEGPISGNVSVNPIKP
jgi:hypothetical protein